MVNVVDIQKKLKKYFIITGYHEIDSSTGVVNVTGNVFLVKKTPHIPVIFGQVGGEFSCSSAGLTSLLGAPHHVGGSFQCFSNKLTSLLGGPRYVGGLFWSSTNPLETLAGAPDHIGGKFIFEYKSHLALLRCLVARGIIMLQAPEQVSQILEKHMGEGKPGAIKAAGELLKAGYKENARW